MRLLPRWCVPVGLLAALWLFYQVLFLSYRPYDVDNPWFLSFSHDARWVHTPPDQFLQVRFPDGMDGVWAFGRIAAVLQRLALEPFGWQQRPAALLSATCVTLALACWWGLLRKLGFTRQQSVFALLLLGLSEPIVSAANRFRYEPVSLLLITLGMLLIAHQRVFVGVLCAALAVETEPAAVCGLLPALWLCYVLRRRTGAALLLPVCSALALSVLLYAALHRVVLHPGTLLVRSGTGSRGGTGVWTGGTLFAFFVERWRHAPELLFFLVVTMLIWRKRYQVPHRFLVVAAGIAAAVLLLMPHANVAYVVFLYPFLVSMAAAVLPVERYERLSIALVLLYFLPQYAALAVHNQGYGYQAKDIAQAADAIRRAAEAEGVAYRGARIFGDYSLWFAHPDHYRAAAATTLEKIGDADLYLCFAERIEPTGLVPAGMLRCGDFKKALSLHEVDTLLLRGHVLHVLVKDAREKTQH